MKTHIENTMRRAHAKWVSTPALHVLSFPDWYVTVENEKDWQDLPFPAMRDKMAEMDCDARQYLADVSFIPRPAPSPARPAIKLWDVALLPLPNPSQIGKRDDSLTPRPDAREFYESPMTIDAQGIEFIPEQTK
jgi:hypothetical protein